MFYVCTCDWEKASHYLAFFRIYLLHIWWRNFGREENKKTIKKPRAIVVEWIWCGFAVTGRPSHFQDYAKKRILDRTILEHTCAHVCAELQFLIVVFSVTLEFRYLSSSEWIHTNSHVPKWCTEMDQYWKIWSSIPFNIIFLEKKPDNIALDIPTYLWIPLWLIDS